MNLVLSPAVVFRRRNGWEAADLGIFLWRNNWFLLVLFMAVPLGILFFFNWTMPKLGVEWTAQLKVFLIWWLKPLLDRFCLQVISVRFFEPHSSLRRLFQGLGKTLKQGLAGDLLWRRFSPFRSARMPLLVLECPGRNEYSRRKLLLDRNGLGFGLALKLICMGMYTVLYLGELFFLYGIISQIDSSTGGFFEFFSEENNIVSVFVFINLILTETLYVCMGFSLYINARVETEGWDIEMLFKKCAEKAKRSFAVPAAVLLFLFAASPLQAQEKPELLQPVPVSESAREILNNVFESSDFGEEKPTRHIQFKERDTRPPFSFPDIRNILGWFLRLTVAALLVLALIVIIGYAWRHRRSRFPASEGRSHALQKTIPDELRRLLEQAEAFHRRGKIREAWALCFRAFIAGFARLLFLPFPADVTEYEALELVRRTLDRKKSEFSGSDPARSDPAADGRIIGADTEAGITSFEIFVRRWTGFAYGGMAPAKGNFEEALASCRSLLENTEGSE